MQLSYNSVSNSKGTEGIIRKNFEAVDDLLDWLLTKDEANMDHLNNDEWVESLTLTHLNYNKFPNVEIIPGKTYEYIDDMLDDLVFAL